MFETELTREAAKVDSLKKKIGVEKMSKSESLYDIAFNFALDYLEVGGFGKHPRVTINVLDGVESEFINREVKLNVGDMIRDIRSAAKKANLLLDCDSTVDEIAEQVETEALAFAHAISLYMMAYGYQQKETRFLSVDGRDELVWGNFEKPITGNVPGKNG